MEFNAQNPLRLGTRKSALALAQTHSVCAALKQAFPELAAEGALHIVKIETLGDQTQSANLSLVEHGGKALWATEHESAIRNGDIDCAVHSVKDIPGHMPDDMVMPCILPRENPFDVFLSPKADHFDDLPKGAIVGTSSPRRAAVTLARRPDIEIHTFRGNVESRLAKLAAGVVDGTYLAYAGLQRAELTRHIQTVLGASDMVPAVGQGAIGIEFLKDRKDLAEIFGKIHCEQSGMCVAAERGWLKMMDGSCKSPLGAYAYFSENNENEMTLHYFAATLDGSDTRTGVHTAKIGNEDEARDWGVCLGRDLKASLPAGFIAEEI